MLGEKKVKVPFGQRKSTGAFGKKPHTEKKESRFGEKIKPSNRIKETTIKEKVYKPLKVKSENKRVIKPESETVKKVSSFKKTSAPLRKKSKQKIESLSVEEHKLNKEYNAWLHEEAQGYNYPCFACGATHSDHPLLNMDHLENIEVNKETTFKTDKIEWHHVKEHSSDIKDDEVQIPLCGNKCHKLGSILSAHGTPVRFKKIFPMKIQRKVAKIIYNDFLEYKRNAFYLE